MNFLPKNRQKRNQFFMALGVTVVLVFGLGFGLVRPQYATLAGVRKSTADTQSHLKSIQRMVQQSDAASNELDDVSSILSSSEGDMARGDVYAWTVDTMRHFKADYKVDVPEIGQPGISDEDLFLHFPYKQLRFTVHGTGYYHDIGKFIADLENKFPHMRVVNLEMSPASSDSEKLSFSMDIIALMKSSS
jgi:hypothetical protein